MKRKSLPKNQIIIGDCQDILKNFPDNSIDLIVTSPPYMDKRKHVYDGAHADDYVNWFIPKAKEFLRVLKPSGTFILNIKEGVVNGEKHTFVLELILEMKKLGWLWTEEFIWHKKNSYPGKWPNRFRDAWERCLQFNKLPKFQMFQDSVMVPRGNWAEKRFKYLTESDLKRNNSRVRSGFGKNIANWMDRKFAYPTNVLYMATESANKNHSAVFPEALPEWFIKLFTKENDIVLDPFIGSGTTAVVAKRLKRDYIGIDIKPEFRKIALERIKINN